MADRVGESSGLSFLSQPVRGFEMAGSAPLGHICLPQNVDKLILMFSLFMLDIG